MKNILFGSHTIEAKLKEIGITQEKKESKITAMVKALSEKRRSSLTDEEFAEPGGSSKDHITERCRIEGITLHPKANPLPPCRKGTIVYS